MTTDGAVARFVPKVWVGGCLTERLHIEIGGLMVDSPRILGLSVTLVDGTPSDPDLPEDRKLDITEAASSAQGFRDITRAG